MNVVTRVQVPLEIDHQESANAPTRQHQAIVEQRVAKTLAALARDNGEKLIACGVQAATPIIKWRAATAEVVSSRLDSPDAVAPSSPVSGVMAATTDAAATSGSTAAPEPSAAADESAGCAAAWTSRLASRSFFNCATSAVRSRSLSRVEMTVSSERVRSASLAGLAVASALPEAAADAKPGLGCRRFC